MRCEMQGISNDIYLTVVSVCRGYHRRERMIEGTKGESAEEPIKQQAEKLNRIVSESVRECCSEWIADDMIDCIGDMTGFRRYRNNHLISKYAYDSCKRAAVTAIARKLALM